MGRANAEKTSFKYGRRQLSFGREDYVELPWWMKKVQKVLEYICSPYLRIQGQLKLRDLAARWSIKDCNRTEKVLLLLKADARLSPSPNPLTMKLPRREENEPRRPLRKGEERRKGGKDERMKWPRAGNEIISRSPRAQKTPLHFSHEMTIKWREHERTWR